MSPKALLLTIGFAELGTGMALLSMPALVAELLLGQPLDSAVALVIARVTGSALIAIGLACLLEVVGRHASAPTALLFGLLAYNIAVAVVLLHGYFAERLGGIGLWPAVVAHLAFTPWIARCLARRPP